MKKVDLAIIGAGSAGLSAYKEAKRFTDKIAIIDHGPLGTTCARVGCMPSKVLIQAADYFHERKYFKERGIHGADKLAIHIPEVMSYVRKLRDYYTSGVLKYIDSLSSSFINQSASFESVNALNIAGDTLEANSILIATGSHPIIPDDWQDFKEQVMTSDDIFEQVDFADEIAVIGAGVIGLELGQALSRLGIKTHIYHRGEFIGGLSDPVVNQYAIDTLRDEFDLCLNCSASVTKSGDDLLVSGHDHRVTVKQVVAALGRRPNLDDLNLAVTGMVFDASGVPVYDKSTMQIDELPIYLAGDVNKMRPLLHEAADEGRIAGYNAVHKIKQCFKRRTQLTILFTQPNIAIVGQSFRELKNTDIAIGEVLFDDQGRSRLMSKNKGILHIYAEKKSGLLLGAEMIAPFGEHIAHMLAWAIQQNMTAAEVLRMPYYHPTVQEGMRTALRDLVGKLSCRLKHESELSLCDSGAHPNLA